MTFVKDQPCACVAQHAAIFHGHDVARAFVGGHLVHKALVAPRGVEGGQLDFVHLGHVLQRHSAVDDAHA